MHTLGPWSYEQPTFDGDEGIIITAESTGSVVAEVLEFDIDDADEIEANARLIAAAPNMRDALVDLIEQIAAYDYQHGENSCPICPEAAKRAISKAGGNQ